jgi:putative MATE family efflux protein
MPNENENSANKNKDLNNNRDNLNEKPPPTDNLNHDSSNNQPDNSNPRGFGRRRLSSARDWTQGSIFKNLLTLAWPILISNSLNMLGPIIDMVWVGKLGASGMAAVGLSGQIVMVVNALVMGLFTSLRAMVARRIGEGDDKGANHAFQQAFIIGIAFSAIMAVIGVFLSKYIIGLFGAQPDVVKDAVPYNRIQFVSTVTMCLRMMTEATMQASGDTKTAMWIGVCFRTLHIALCPFLVFGLWIFPELGVSGAALTGVISQLLGGIAGLWILMAGYSRLHVTFKGFFFDWDNIWRQVKIGIPSSANQMLRSFLGLLITKIIVPFGTFSLAAYVLIQRIDGFLDVGASAIGNAAGALSGQSLGAKKPERAEKTGWLAVGLGTGLMAVISIAIFIWADEVVRIFNSNPGVVALASTLIRIACINYIVIAPASVLTSCLNQVGDTMIPLIASMATMWGIQLPLAYFLPKVFDNGVFGVMWAMVIALSVRAIAYLVYFRTGKWKYRRV